MVKSVRKLLGIPICVSMLTAASLALGCGPSAPADSPADLKGAGSSPTSVPAARELVFPMPEDPRYEVAMTVPEDWAVIGRDDRDYVIGDASNGSPAIEMRIPGRLIDWMGYDDGTAMMTEWLLADLEAELARFEVVSSARSAATGFKVDVVEFSHLVNAERVRGLAYATGDPYGIWITSKGIADDETYSTVGSVLGSIEVRRAAVEPTPETGSGYDPLASTAGYGIGPDPANVQGVVNRAHAIVVAKVVSFDGSRAEGRMWTGL